MRVEQSIRLSRDDTAQRLIAPRRAAPRVGWARTRPPTPPCSRSLAVTTRVYRGRLRWRAPWTRATCRQAIGRGHALRLRVLLELGEKRRREPDELAQGTAGVARQP